MAHFAQLDNQNMVVAVIVVDNNDAPSETAGQHFIKSLGLNGVWLQTSYNGTIRKNYAGIGYTYDPVRDAFIPPQPHPSWVLNETTCLWEPPVPYPSGGDWVWNENTQTWEPVDA